VAPPKRRSAPVSRKAASRKGGARKAGRKKAPVRRSRKAKSAAPQRTWARRLGWWSLKWTLVIGTGAGLGAGFVGWVLYEQALVDVEERLAGEVWSPSGRVMSAPVEVWPGLALTPDALALDLQSAGYARVTKPDKPGDFSLGGQDLVVRVPEASGPGWKVGAQDVHVAFADGRVQAVSPNRRARFAPAQLAGLRGAENEARRPVSLDTLPPHVVDAVLAMEDARFWEHEGVDPLGVARAVLINTVTDRPLQGGSTLTQQLVKNLFLTQERTLERKGREALLALAIERTHSKREILELYLNEIYLGQVGGAGVCGVDEAARAYFGKPATRLDLAESATLAGIISAPNRYSPLRHPESAVERRNVTLARMVTVGKLDAEAARTAQASKLAVHPGASGKTAPWIVDAAVEQVEAAIGEGSLVARGVTVHTTVQPALQRLAEAVVQRGIAALEKEHSSARGAQMALVAVRVSDGAVVAMVGGRDYGASQFNRAINAHRQLGSTIKPLTALLAFEADLSMSPATRLPDEPFERTIDGKRWAPKNYDGRYLGDVDVRTTIVHSRNVPAVHLAEGVGMASLARQWKALGLSGATSRPSSALGAFEATPLEVAAAYTVFPGRGEWARPSLVRAATDDGGNLLWNEDPITVRRVSARAAWLATTLLEDVIDDGTGRAARRLGVTGAVGGKTGTTDQERDAWFAGFTGELAVAVWVGHDRGKDLGLTGAQAALPAWSQFVAGSGTAGRSFTRPKGLVQVTVCADTGLPPTDTCTETTQAWFTEGYAPEPEPEPETSIGRAWEDLKVRITPKRERGRGLFGRRR
jgi:penicillin-binding protein 1B